MLFLLVYCHKKMKGKKDKATSNLLSSTIDGDGARSLRKKSSVKKKSASTKTMVTRSKGSKTKGKRKKKEVAATPPTSNKSPKKTQAKELPNETSILVRNRTERVTRRERKRWYHT